MSNEPIKLEDDSKFVDCICGESYPIEEEHECEDLDLAD